MSGTILLIVGIIAAGVVIAMNIYLHTRQGKFDKSVDKMVSRHKIIANPVLLTTVLPLIVIFIVAFLLIYVFGG
ncbi:hypothetical protein [Paenibacillus gansuensis]|uniref:Uncharacterized protein n=1 Tax=Paenibacillus gansuensis TaxID=306542 RepID=A0ABW5PJ16_9BACL